MLLHIQTVICDEMLPSADYLWVQEKTVSYKTFNKYTFTASFCFNESKVKKHKWKRNIMWKIRFSVLWASLAWSWWRLLFTQGLLGGLQVALATGSGFRGRFGASLWVLTVFQISHCFHIAATAHPSTRDLSSFSPSATQSTSPVPQWDLD